MNNESKNKNRIREIRNSRKMSGVAIAEELGISPQYYYDIERGKKNLSASKAAKLAQIFNVTIDYLLGEDRLGDVYVKNRLGVNEKEENDYLFGDLSECLNEVSEGAVDFPKFYPDAQKYIKQELGSFFQANNIKSDFSYQDIVQIAYEQNDTSFTEKLIDLIEKAKEKLIIHNRNMETEGAKRREFEGFINHPDNNLFFKELLEAPEERIEDLKKVWEIIKRAAEPEDK